MSLRLPSLLLAGLAFLAHAETLWAQVAAKASYVPSDLDISLDGKSLLQRVVFEIKPRGADLALRCAWGAIPPASSRLAVPCQAGDVAATLIFEQVGPGVLTATADLGRDVPLDAEDGLKLTAVLAGVEHGVAFVRSEPWWMRPVFFRQQAFVGGEAQLVLGEREKDYVALLPLAAGGAAGWGRGANIAISGGGITTALASFAPWSVRRAPLAVFARNESPYAAVADSYAQGLAAMGHPGRLRVDKPYPEPFTRVGFCTWNAFYENQTAANLAGAARAFQAAAFPLGFFIIDAGWQQYSGGSIFFQKLKSFSADEKKLPEGLKSAVDAIKAATGARWVGAWHALQGVPGGIDPASELARAQAAHLWTGAGGVLVPDPTSDRGRGFYDAFYRYLKDAGIDLIKVDFQNWLETPLRGRVPIFQGMQQAIYNFHAAAKQAFGDRVINCMSEGSDALFNLRDTNVVRNSLDYLLPAGPVGHRRHVLNNVFNSLAVQQVAYPDFDMFESYGEFATYHSVLRALSGGPVYFTGDVAKQDWALLRRLILADGTVLRTDVPVVPTRDSLFVDAGTVPVPLKGFSRVGDTGLVGVFNVHEDGAAVSGQLRARDVEGLTGDRFAVLEYFSRRRRVVSRDEAMPLQLAPNQAELYWVVPVVHGAAPFGLLDKYVAPRTILSSQDDGQTLKITVAEGGRLGSYLEHAPQRVAVDGVAVSPTWKDGLLEVTVDANRPGPRVVEIVR
jgi:raffinose synthase